MINHNFYYNKQNIIRASLLLLIITIITINDGNLSINYTYYYLR